MAAKDKTSYDKIPQIDGVPDDCENEGFVEYALKIEAQM